MARAKKVKYFLFCLNMLSVFCLCLYGCDRKEEDAVTAISFLLDPMKVSKVVCCNAYFPKERDVVVTERKEIEFLVGQLSTLTFDMVQAEAEKDDDVGSMMTGGYAQFLDFYDENAGEIGSVRLESSTRLVLMQDGYEYSCTISEDSELSRRLEELVNAYWEY